MTKQDYEALAALLKATRNGEYMSPAQALDQLTWDMADYLATRSPHFDRDKFLAAAGTQ